MAFKILVVAAIVAFIYSEASAQLFGRETNSAGINHFNKYGTIVYASGSQTHGSPAPGTVRRPIPIVSSGNARLSAPGEITFGGVKPGGGSVPMVSSGTPVYATGHTTFGGK